MGKIIVLKEINEKENNEINCFKFNTADFKWEQNGTTKTRKAKLVTNNKTGKQSFIKNQYKAWLGDQKTYTEKMSNTWSEIFPPASGGLMGNMNKLLSLTGLGSLQSKGLYTQVWTSSQPMTFSFRIKFIAETDAYEDVVKPIRELQKMCSPTEVPPVIKKLTPGQLRTGTDDTRKKASNQNLIKEEIVVTEVVNIANAIQEGLFDTMLGPPNTSVINFKRDLSEDTSEGVHSIQIGNFVTLKDIVLQNIEASFDMSNVDVNGQPLMAEVTLDIKSRTIWTEETFKQLLLTGQDTLKDPTVIDFTGIGESIKNIAEAVTGFKFGG